MARAPRDRSRAPRAKGRRLPRPGAIKAEDEELSGGRLVLPYDPHAGIPNDAEGIWFFLSGPTARVYDLIAGDAVLRSWLYALRADHRRPGQGMFVEDEDAIETFATLIGGHFEMQRELAAMSEEQFRALEFEVADPAHAREIAAAIADLDLDDVDWEQLAGILAPLADAALPYGDHGTKDDLPGVAAPEESDQG